MTLREVQHKDLTTDWLAYSVALFKFFLMKKTPSVAHGANECAQPNFNFSPSSARWGRGYKERKIDKELCRIVSEEGAASGGFCVKFHITLYPSGPPLLHLETVCFEVDCQRLVGQVFAVGRSELVTCTKSHMGR